jgi:sec-independent protein translocase protein TatA
MTGTLDIASHATLAFGFGGNWEWIIILVIGLLLFGRRLPEVGRGVGRSIVEFRKGIQGIEDEVEEASKKSSASESKNPEKLPSSSARTDMVQPDSRSVSQEPVMPKHPASNDPEPQGN